MKLVKFNATNDETPARSAVKQSDDLWMVFDDEEVVHKDARIASTASDKVSLQTKASLSKKHPDIAQLMTDDEYVPNVVPSGMGDMIIDKNGKMHNVFPEKQKDGSIIWKRRPVDSVEMDTFESPK